MECSELSSCRLHGASSMVLTSLRDLQVRLAERWSARRPSSYVRPNISVDHKKRETNGPKMERFMVLSGTSHGVVGTLPAFFACLLARHTQRKAAVPDLARLSLSRLNTEADPVAIPPANVKL